MNEDPYKSPQSSLRADNDDGAPLWRRIVSLPLITIGALWLLCMVVSTPDALVAILLEKDRAAIFWYSSAVAIGVAVIWIGLKLRRPKKAPQRSVGAL
jgi:hypothetical protein